MTETTRDQIWDAVIEELVSEGRFKISDLDEFDEGQRHTVRRVLKAQEEMGYLKRKKERGRIWRAGPKAKKLFALSDRAHVLADME